MPPAEQARDVADSVAAEAVGDQTSTGDQAAPRLPTSHDIVQRVRRWSGQRRIGHTGTLDPMASGVLVLCLGLATRLVEYYQGHPKWYYAEIALGTTTDTYDATGAVIDQADDLPPFTTAAVDAALAQFRGTIQQRPPIYSALKQGGEAAYRRARRGETVDLPTRPVTFYDLELVGLPAPNRIALRAYCSAGTYIRSLAYDIAQALGAPGHLALLRREAAGAFTLDDAHSMADIEAAATAGRLTDLLLPPGERLGLPVCDLDEAQIRALGFGQQVALPLDQITPAASPVAPAELTAAPQTESAEPLVQAYRADGRFLGIIRRLTSPHTETAIWKAEKWLVTQETEMRETVTRETEMREIVTRETEMRETENPDRHGADSQTGDAHGAQGSELQDDEIQPSKIQPSKIQSSER